MNAWCVTAILGGSHPKSKTLPETNSFPSWEWMVGGFKDFQLQPDRSLGKLHPFDGEKIVSAGLAQPPTKLTNNPRKMSFLFFPQPGRESSFWWMFGSWEWPFSVETSPMEVSMDVLFFLFFQATVRCLAADPTDTEGLRPVLGLLQKPILEPLGCLDGDSWWKDGFLGFLPKNVEKHYLVFLI